MTINVRKRSHTTLLTELGLPTLPLHLGPTIVVALDERGAGVARRLASLLRANARTDGKAADAAIRNRFGFLQIITTDPKLRGLTTEVQAIRIEPSTPIWDIELAQWENQPIVAKEPPQTFGQALEATVQDVLNYADVREDLLLRDIVVRPSHLNIFFVGSLIEEVTLTTNLLDPDADKQMLNEIETHVENKLSELKRLAERTLAYASDSANIDVVVRGAFLTLILPDSIELAKLAIGSNGIRLGELLKQSSGRLEPPLHFCSIYTGHDQDGAWYNPVQLANVLASAIYALIMSEMIDEQVGRQQLGLQDLAASPYARLITIAAMRSTFPRAEMLDYAALRYGADLLEQLLPTMPAQTPAMRNQIREHADNVFDYDRLRRLVTRPVGNPYDQRGRPQRLSDVAQNVDPPDLLELIPNPRAGLFESWGSFVDRALDELERSNLLLNYLQEPDAAKPGSGYRFVDDQDGRPLDLPRLDGSVFIYSQETILNRWHGWRKRLDDSIGDNPHETRSRLEGLRHEIERMFWGHSPTGRSAPVFREQGFQACEAILDHIQERTNDLRTLIVGSAIDETTAASALDEQLQRARSQGQNRMRFSPIIVLAIIVGATCFYLIDALQVAPTSGPLIDFARHPDIVIQTPFIDSTWTLPFIMYTGILAGGIILLLGSLLRLVQSLLAVSAIRKYATLIRQRFALQMYHDEQRRLMMIPEHIERDLKYIQKELIAHKEAVHRASTELTGRAKRLADQLLRDVTEYIPLAHGGLVALYERTVERYKQEQITNDLKALRGIITSMDPKEFGSITANKREDTDKFDATAEIEKDARQRLVKLVLGEADVSELDQRARLRYLAYKAVRDSIVEIDQQSISQDIATRAVDLSRRTRLMMSNVPHKDTYEQGYTIVPFTSTAQSADLAGTLEVRSIDHQMVMFLRIVSHVWPRLFEEAEIKLDVKPS